MSSLVSISIACVIVFFAPALGALFGAFSGFVVGWVFNETSAEVLTIVGIPGFAMWKVGATLGFLGGFFRSSFKNSINKD